MAWGGCVGAAGYPMGCQIGRLMWHETPLARPSQATKISKPNSFAYPFQSRPRGVPRPPRLDLAAAKTSSYRDTANLGFGVTPRPRAEGAFSRCAIFTAFWVFSAFKMRVYLGRIVELDREPTCEVGPELAIYRSVTVTGCDEHRGRRGEQAAPFSSAAFQ